MFSILHFVLEIAAVALLVFVLLKLENMHRTLDRLSGNDPDAAPDQQDQEPPHAEQEP